MLELFASGNDDPQLTNRKDFHNLLASKDFRVALSLTDIEAVWQPGQPPYVTHQPAIIVPGYTPINVWTRSLTSQWSFRTLGHSGGAGRPYLWYSRQKTVLTIHVLARFKICWWLNMAGATIMAWPNLKFHLAPWALVYLKYSLQPTGHVQIEFSGSLIPSQRYFVDWNLSGSHDMMSIGAPDLVDFITAGNCVDAPVKRLHAYGP